MISNTISEQLSTMMIGERLRQGVEHHRADRLLEAERLYRMILQVQPDHPDANHNLGVLAVQMNQAAAGVPYFKKAVEANPKQGQYWVSYIEALIQSEQIDAARQVLELGYQRGLNGTAVETLASRLGNSVPLASVSNDQGNGLPPAPPEPAQGGKENPATNFCETGRTARKTAAPHINTPSHQERERLVYLFNEERYSEATVLAQKMTSRFPGHGFGWKVLGAIFMRQGKARDALTPLRNAVSLSPQDAEAHCNLGITLKNLSLLGEAATSCRRALEIRPDYAEAYNNLAASLIDMDLMDEAEASCRRALEIRPDYAEAHCNLGIIFKSLGRLDESEASYRKSLEINPNYAETHNNLGIILQMVGRLDEAAASCRRALEIRSDYAEAYNNLGVVLVDMGKLDEAVTSYRRALEIKPDYAEAYNNIGNILNEFGWLDEAEISFRRAIEIRPDYAEAHNNLSGTLKDMGRVGEAEAIIRKALEIKPDYFKAHSNMLFMLSYSPTSNPTCCFDEALRYGQKVTSKVRYPFSRWLCEKTPSRLRIGLVSGDFRNHPVGFFLENLLTHIDLESVVLIAYSTAYESDALTERIKPYFAVWRQVTGYDDGAAANLIHEDGVHVLLDLSGHTRRNRLPIFAWKPAPIQVSWLGYFATTGVAEIDYLIADPWTLLTSEEVYFTEKVWRLPETRLCFTPPDVSIEISPLPVLENGYITFGCFNNLTKMNDDVVALWSRVLESVKNSRLFLKAKQLNSASVKQQTLERFAAHGVTADRLILEGAESRDKYFAAYHKVDIALDPFPFPGGTTSVESLWMGVPVLTLGGARFLSRQGVGIMMNAGMSEWVAYNVDDYLTFAVSHAEDRNRLSILRSTLRQHMLSSPMMDGLRFAKNFEVALRNMWYIWEENQENK